VAVGTIEKSLVMIHGLLAGLTKIDEWTLDPDTEAKPLAEAVASVIKHYPAFQASEKATDWINLGMCAAFIYGGRIRHTMQVMAQRRPARAPRATMNGSAPQAERAPGFQKVVIPGVGEVEVPVQ
jgi:hypothetical protein